MNTERLANKAVSSADKLARQVLKAAWRYQPGQLLTVALIASWYIEESPDGIRVAMAHAVREGWLTEQNNAWSVTPAGEDVGRRSRAAVTNRRRY